MTLQDKCKEIKLVLFDVDGVLTNGDVYIESSGEAFKQFNVKDGVSVALLKIHGILSGVISGKHSDALEARCSQLKFDFVVTGCHNKIEALNQIIETHGISASEIAFVGDDVIDLTVLNAVGLSFSPVDGHALVKQCVEVITESAGGKGVAREVSEFILMKQGLSIEEVYQPLLDHWNETEVVQ